MSLVQHCLSCRLALGALLVAAPWLSASVGAAPPTVDYLLPAGGNRGTTVEVTLGGKPGEGALQVDVEGAGLHVTPGEKPGQLSVAIDSNAVPGHRWLRVSNDEGSATPLPFVVGTIDELLEIEPNDAAQQAQEIGTLPRLVNGQVGKAGDVDTFAVELKAGDTLIAVVDAHSVLGSPMDAVLQLLSPAGFVIAQNDDERGLDPALVFEVNEDGRYMVRLFAFPAQPNQSISFSGGSNYVYRLTLTTPGYVDRAQPLAVRRGESTPVELHGWNLDEPMRHQVVTPTADQDTIVLFHPAAAGSVVLPVLEQAIAAEPATDQEPLIQRIDVPSTVSGCLVTSGQEDFYLLNGEKDQSLLFSVVARQLGYPLDPVLRLLDADGNVLKELDDAGGGRDVEFVHKLPVAGEYRVSVRDLHGHASARNAYRLAVEPLVPDFRLTVSQHAFVLKPTEPLEIEVSVSRLHGFAGTIEVNIEGLPDDVVVTPATSAAEGDQAKKVTLKLESAGASWSGAMRIVGLCVEPERSRRAIASLNVENATTERIWLTRLPPAESKEAP